MPRTLTRPLIRHEHTNRALVAVAVLLAVAGAVAVSVDRAEPAEYAETIPPVRLGVDYVPAPPDVTAGLDVVQFLVEHERITAERNAEIAAERREAARRAAERRASRSAQRRSPGGAGGTLACIRSHEGSYGSVSPSGKYRGAYQFDRSTGAGAVSRAGYPEYAGVPANEWPPHVQDAAAAQLLAERGLQPWPTPNRLCR